MKKLRIREMTSLLMKIVTIVSALFGTYKSAMGGRKAFMGGGSVFMYFTIQSNIAVALIALAGLICLMRGKKVGRAGQIVKFVGTVAITLTGVVFCFVLAPTMKRGAWSLPNVLTHVVVPIAAVLDFFFASAEYRYQTKDVLWVTVPPILYAVYAAVGFVRGWEFAPGVNYPYFFLNWGSPLGAFGFGGELPFMGCVWWILALLLFLIGVGYGYLALHRRFRRR